VTATVASNAAPSVTSSAGSRWASELPMVPVAGLTWPIKNRLLHQRQPGVDEVGESGSRWRVMAHSIAPPASRM
jgi:hypothetical protein